MGDAAGGGAVAVVQISPRFDLFTIPFCCADGAMKAPDVWSKGTGVTKFRGSDRYDKASSGDPSVHSILAEGAPRAVPSAPLPHGHHLCARVYTASKDVGSSPEPSPR